MYINSFQLALILVAVLLIRECVPEKKNFKDQKALRQQSQQNRGPFRTRTYIRSGRSKAEKPWKPSRLRHHISPESLNARPGIVEHGYLQDANGWGDIDELELDATRTIRDIQVLGRALQSHKQSSSDDDV